MTRTGGAAAAAARQTSGITTRLIIRHVRARLGADGVGALLEHAGQTRPAAELEDEHGWSTYAEKVALLGAAAEVLHDPDAARHIGETVLEERVGLPVKTLLRALGSPGQVLRNVARAAQKFSSVCSMEAVEVGARSAVVTYRLHEGFPPDRLDCDYNIGLISQIPVLFGRPPASVTHDECQVDGAERCVYRVRWQARGRRLWRPARARVVDLEDRLSTLTERTEALQSTVADLVSTDDVETVLARIAKRAAGAVGAPQYVLAVRREEEAPLEISWEGLDETEARRLAAELLAGPAAHPPDGARLVAEVASSRRRYGLLAAINTGGAPFFPEEQRLLRAYARHAAAALDAATALQTARVRGETAALLLDLSQTLAGAASSDEIARRLADAAPQVTGARRAVVALWDADAMRLAVRGVHGLDDETARRLMSFSVTPEQTTRLVSMVNVPEPMYVDDAGADEFTRAVLAAYESPGFLVVPMVSRGHFLGTVAVDNGPAGGPLSVTSPLQRRLRGLADQAATALDNVRLLEAERLAVQQLRESEAQARHQAYHDPVTRLPNRLLFVDRTAMALAAARRHGHRAAVMFLDLDDFKRVNDSLGHECGDELLRQVAERLRSSTRDEDTVARFGGDEFTVLLPHVGEAADVAKVAGGLLARLRLPFCVEGHDVRVSASIGIALHPEDGTDPDALLRRADMAMYRVKEEGRDGYRAFSDLEGDAPDD